MNQQLCTKRLRCPDCDFALLLCPNINISIKLKLVDCIGCWHKQSHLNINLKFLQNNSVNDKDLGGVTSEQLKLSFCEHWIRVPHDLLVYFSITDICLIGWFQF